MGPSIAGENQGFVSVKLSDPYMQSKTVGDVYTKLYDSVLKRGDLLARAWAYINTILDINHQCARIELNLLTRNVLQITSQLANRISSLILSFSLHIMAPKFSSGQTVRYKPVGGQYRPFSALHLNLFYLLHRERRALAPPADIMPSLGPGSNTSESTGVILDVLTEPGMQASRNVQASMQEPRYEVRDTLHAKVTAV